MYTIITLGTASGVLFIKVSRVLITGFHPLSTVCDPYTKILPSFTTSNSKIDSATLSINFSDTYKKK